MRTEKQLGFRRKYQTLARQINTKCLTFVSRISYTEYIHKASYEAGIGYCDNPSERMINNSDIEICRYKGRIKVIMLIGTRKHLTDKQKRAINKILCTNVQYRELETGYSEISFNVNPHKM